MNCPYCDEQATAINAGDESLDWCPECERIIEGIERSLDKLEKQMKVQAE